MHLHRFSLVLALIGLAGCTLPEGPETKPMGEELLGLEDHSQAQSQPVDFAMHVKPILEHRCVMCHNRDTMKGRMNLDNRREALRSGVFTKDIVRGAPERSLLLSYMRSHGNTSVMPIVGVRATHAECEIIAKWIKEGAHWPSGDAGTLDSHQ